MSRRWTRIQRCWLIRDSFSYVLFVAHSFYEQAADAYSALLTYSWHILIDDSIRLIRDTFFLWAGGGRVFSLARGRADTAHDVSDRASPEIQQQVQILKKKSKKKTVVCKYFVQWRDVFFLNFVTKSISCKLTLKLTYEIFQRRGSGGSLEGRGAVVIGGWGEGGWGWAVTAVYVTGWWPAGS